MDSKWILSLVIESPIEVKSTQKITNRDAKGLVAISEEPNSWQHKLIVSQDSAEEEFSAGIRKVHWRKFLENLWDGMYA